MKLKNKVLEDRLHLIAEEYYLESIRREGLRRAMEGSDGADKSLLQDQLIISTIRLSGYSAARSEIQLAMAEDAVK